MAGWIGVDLDGTLAKDGAWAGLDHIGPPIPKVVERVKKLLARGVDVRIFTARVAEGKRAIFPIEKWCQEHLGQILPVTNVKDFDMIEYWDDRAKQVITNKGVFVEDLVEDLAEKAYEC